ncbi:hypothetical protein FA10DRAFT_122816 [Acaromyces ingoldii]|uniref:Uncharacterized protein n=1 Tax=Acaromyces ingoldii TaxID=215250 RepID=A0A316YNZ7_9BASI|nr:hypothetical protein FA10DRAFT_122816 [Acaromyces ingoldii]PWN90756.1 hypothetical protein FA10DRAFT_122816 [Acaromyces ingoldii]
MAISIFSLHLLLAAFPRSKSEQLSQQDEVVCVSVKGASGDLRAYCSIEGKRIVNGPSACGDPDWLKRPAPESIRPIESTYLWLHSFEAAAFFLVFFTGLLVEDGASTACRRPGKREKGDS